MPRPPSAGISLALLAFTLVAACGGVTPTGPRIRRLGPGEHGGDRTCAPFVDPYGKDEARTNTPTPRAAAYFAEREGCACSADDHGQTCAGFPCTAHGCYVRRCSVDADCRAGLCSSHASGPHGYCVTDDPY